MLRLSRAWRTSPAKTLKRHRDLDNSLSLSYIYIYIYAFIPVADKDLKEESEKKPCAPPCTAVDHANKAPAMLANDAPQALRESSKNEA